MFRADGNEKLGDQLFKKFNIVGTPTVMTLDGDGNEVDWVLGYGPPPEKFQAKMEAMVAGTDTYRSLSQAFTKNPKDPVAAFKLARKWAQRINEAKAEEFYRAVIALDPEGKSGTHTDDYYKTTATYTEFAEYALGGSSLSPDSSNKARGPEPMKAFILKYPKSQLLKQAYGRLSEYYFASAASKAEAAAFYADYTSKFPEDPEILDAWLTRITRDKENFEKGAELADRIQFLTRSNPLASLNQDLASFYYAKGDAAEADKVYGKDFMTSRAQSLARDMMNYATYWAGRNANLDAAISAAETALKINPDSSYYLRQAATVYLKAGKEDKALEVFGPAFAQKSMSTVDALSLNLLAGYASFWARQGKNLDSALEAARKAVELSSNANPNAYNGWYALSSVLLARKDYDGALKAAEKAVELAADDEKDYYRKNIEKIKAAQAAAVKK
jgi:tetratricopeptide (TPR) repeat protein